MNIINMDYIQAEQGSGKIACYRAEDNKDIIAFATENKKEIENIINKCGGILLRNFNIRSISEFNKLQTRNVLVKNFV